MPQLYHAIGLVISNLRELGPENTRAAAQAKLAELKPLLSVTPEQWSAAACHDSPELD